MVVPTDFVDVAGAIVTVTVVVPTNLFNGDDVLLLLVLVQLLWLYLLILLMMVMKF